MLFLNAIIIIALGYKNLLNVVGKEEILLKTENFDIQLFNTKSDLWFNENQQHSLISGVQSGLNDLIRGTDALAKGINLLASEWHSPDAAKFGNPVSTELPKVIRANREYVSSIAGWMASNGAKVNTIMGATVSFNKGGDVGNVTVDKFYDDASHRGFKNVDTVSRTAKSLRSALMIVNDGLKKVLSVAKSNPDAMPGGIVPDSLVPKVDKANSSMKSNLTTFENELNKMLSSLDSEIKKAVSSAASAIEGTRS